MTDQRSLNTLAFPADVKIAPDGSQIWELLQSKAASMVRCVLPPGGVSLAVRHRTIEELWYFLSGEGQVWRMYPDGREEEVAAIPGVALRIPIGTHFQFRATGGQPLVFLIVTMPPWPGDGEAERVGDHWPVA